MATNDLLKVSNFLIQFRDQTKLELQVTGTNLPGFSIGVLELPRPVVKDVRPGDQLSYQDLDLTVLCDEDLDAYKEIYTYIITAANPNTGELKVNGVPFDATLYITTNKNNVQHTVKFYNAFFKSIGDIRFESSSPDETHLTFSVGLGFSFFNFE